MKEYLVIETYGMMKEELETLLNQKSAEGWDVVCDSISGLILARNKKYTETKINTYSVMAHPAP